MSFSSWFEMILPAKKYHCLFMKLCGLLIIVGGMVQAGCSQMPLHRQMTPLPPGPVCRVAVLPFLNDSDFPLADTIVNKVFTTQLQKLTNFLISQEGDVHKTYQQLRILPGKAPTLEQLQIIADRVDAQLLITGIIIEMRANPGEHQTVNPLIVMEIQLRDGRSGETLWTAFHRRQGTDYKKTMHFGTIHTVTGLSRQMAVEIINLWLEKGLAQCDVLPQS
jgi:hypothetical protein